MPTRAPRPCRDCQRLSYDTRCPTCARWRTQQRDAQRDAQRGNSAQRGYGAAHRRRREQLLATALGTACPRCGRVMTHARHVDAGHSTALALDPGGEADRLECSSCNRAAGATVRRR